MKHTTQIFLFVTLMIVPLRGFAQLITPEAYPIHILIGNIKAENEQPDKSNNKRAVIVFGGMIENVYKNIPSVSAAAPALYPGEQIKFNIPCYPPEPLSPLGLPVTGTTDDETPQCDSIRTAPSMEIWAYSGANGLLTKIRTQVK